MSFPIIESPTLSVQPLSQQPDYVGSLDWSGYQGASQTAISAHYQRDEQTGMLSIAETHDIQCVPGRSVTPVQIVFEKVIAFSNHFTGVVPAGGLVTTSWVRSANAAIQREIQRATFAFL